MSAWSRARGAWNVCADVFFFWIGIRRLPRLRFVRIEWNDAMLEIVLRSDEGVVGQEYGIRIDRRMKRVRRGRQAYRLMRCRWMNLVDPVMIVASLFCLPFLPLVLIARVGFRMIEDIFKMSRRSFMLFVSIGRQLDRQTRDELQGVLENDWKYERKAMRRPSYKKAGEILEDTRLNIDVNEGGVLLLSWRDGDGDLVASGWRRDDRCFVYVGRGQFSGKQAVALAECYRSAVMISRKPYFVRRWLRIT